MPVCQRPDCGKPIARNQHDSVVSWGKRQYCSMQCANAVRQVKIHGVFSPAVKPCQHCGKEAVQRHNEAPASFLARKYCSRDCAAAARQNGQLSSREQRVVQRQQRPPRPDRSTKHLDVDTANKPLIRDIPAIPVKPEPGVWRPAAWRAMDQAR